MPLFLAKVTEIGGNELPTVGVNAADAASAEALVRSLPHVGTNSEIELREPPRDIANKRLSAVPEGEAIILADVVWSGDQPAEK